MINHRADAATFRVLLLPVKAGEPLPEVSFDADQGIATVHRPGAETDVLKFLPLDGNATLVTVTRDGHKL